MYPSMVAGDSYAWRNSLADYPASAGWTLTHLLRGQSSGNPITITAIPDGDDYVSTVTPTVSGGWDPGVYTVVAQVAKSGERKTLDAVAISEGRIQSTQVVILANPSEGDPYDGRTFAEKQLERIETAMAALNTGVQSYTIGDRSWTRADVPELLVMRDRFRAEVASEKAARRIAAGLGNPKRVLVRFGRV